MKPMNSLADDARGGKALYRIRGVGTEEEWPVYDYAGGK
jgi:hypothetical protein